MQMLTLLHSETFPIGRYAEGLSRESIAAGRLHSVDELRTPDGPGLRVALVDRNLLGGRRAALQLDPRTAVGGVGPDHQPQQVRQVSEEGECRSEHVWR